MYHIVSPYFTLGDKPLQQNPSKESLERQFNDYYHLFLTKVARMPQEKALTQDEEERMAKLFFKLNSLKREIESQ